MKTRLFLFFTFFSFFTIAQVPNYVPSDGLVTWWPFNGNANDESGNGLDGTYNGIDLPTADYYYILDLGNGEKYNGVVTLKR